MLHGHGDDIYHQQHKIKANFSSNVPQLQNLPVLQHFWAQKLGMLTSYPEANASSFVNLLANKYDIEPSQIMATHGATEAIYLIAQAFGGCTSAILQPSFAEYADACNINKHKVLNITSTKALESTDAQLIWLCNPNNPNGKVWHYETLLQMIDSNKDTTYIIDQTYRYFTTKKTLTYKDAVSRSNLILIDSFTKRYAVPGLRLGYMVTHKNSIAKLTAIKPPWSVNQLAIETGKYLLTNNNILPLDLNQLLEYTAVLQQSLARLKHIKVYPTDTHFFLCKLTGITAQQLKDRLLKQYGILIRNADNFVGLDKYFIRIATQNKAQNKLLTEAMQQILG